MPELPDPLDDLAVGYVLPTETEAAEIWKGGIFVVDANVLLNVYRYPPAARDELLKALETVQDRLFVPYQSAQEYFRNRIPVITSQQTAKEKMLSGIDAAVSALIKTLEDTHAQMGRRDKPSELMSKTREHLATLREEFSAAEDSWLQDIDPRADEFHPRLVALLRGRVGRPFGDDRLPSVEQEAQRRVANREPPGYLDSEKEDGGLGDYFFWRQLLDHAKTATKHVILVTDDVKDDWRWNSKGREIGPRPELARELYAEAGTKLLMCTTPRFLERSSADRERPIDPDILEEVKAQSARYKSEPPDLMAALKASLNAVRDRQAAPATLIPLRSPKVTAPTGSKALGVQLDGTTPGRLTCVVRGPDGHRYLWSGEISIESSVHLRFPDDFVNLKSGQPIDRDGLSPGAHIVEWRLAPDDPGVDVVEVRARFMLRPRP
jgi:hypothetical protein